MHLSALSISRLHEALGLSNAVKSPHGGVVAGAAAIRLSTHNFFADLDIPIMEMYGATESQLQTVGRPGESRTETSAAAAEAPLTGIR